MTKTAFILGPFAAEGLNLSNSSFVTGVPSPSAALGLIGAIAYELGAPSWGHKAVFVIHQLEAKAGRVRGEQNASSKRIVPLEIPENVTGRGLFSIIAEIEGNFSTAEIANAFSTKRFGGGVIFPRSGETFANLVKIVDDENFEQQISRLPRGFALAPANGIAGANITSTGDATSLERIAMRVFNAEEKRQGGYVTSIPCGYRVLKGTIQDAPKHSRTKDVPFAFAEAVVGIGHYVSIRKREQFASLDEAFEKHGWQWAVSNDGSYSMFSKFHLETVAA